MAIISPDQDPRACEPTGAQRDRIVASVRRAGGLVDQIDRIVMTPTRLLPDKPWYLSVRMHNVPDLSGWMHRDGTVTLHQVEVVDPFEGL